MFSSKSITKQQEILGNPNLRKRISTMQKDTTSLLSMVDSASYLSRRSEGSSKLSMLFDFDDDLFTSRPYKALIRKTVKLSIRTQKQSDDSESSQALIRPTRRSSSLNSTRSIDAYRQTAREQIRPTKVLLLGRLKSLHFVVIDG